MSTASCCCFIPNDIQCCIYMLTNVQFKNILQMQACVAVPSCIPSAPALPLPICPCRASVTSAGHKWNTRKPTWETEWWCVGSGHAVPAGLPHPFSCFCPLSLIPLLTHQELYQHLWSKERCKALLLLLVAACYTLLNNPLGSPSTCSDFVFSPTGDTVAV